jgi:hypothetical protein
MISENRGVPSGIMAQTPPGYRGEPGRFCLSLAFEPVMRWFFEKYDTTAARYIPPEGRRSQLVCD